MIELEAESQTSLAACYNRNKGEEEASMDIDGATEDAEAASKADFTESDDDLFSATPDQPSRSTVSRAQYLSFS